MDPDILRQADAIQEYARFITSQMLTFIGIIIAGNAAVAAVLLQGLHKKAIFLPLVFILFDGFLCYWTAVETRKKYLDMNTAWEQLKLAGWSFPFMDWAALTRWIAGGYACMAVGWIFYWIATPKT